MVERDRTPKYFGINERGYGRVFDTIAELEFAEYSFVREVYIQYIESADGKELQIIPKEAVKPPKFDISIEKTYLVLPDGTKKQYP